MSINIIPLFIMNYRPSYSEKWRTSILLWIYALFSFTLESLCYFFSSCLEFKIYNYLYVRSRYFCIRLRVFTTLGSPEFSIPSVSPIILIYKFIDTPLYVSCTICLWNNLFPIGHIFLYYFVKKITS